MEARYKTHLLIDGLQREKMLETQAKQEQVLPVAVLAQEVTVPRTTTTGRPTTSTGLNTGIDVAECVVSSKVQTQQWVSTHFAAKSSPTVPSLPAVYRRVALTRLNAVAHTSTLLSVSQAAKFSRSSDRHAGVQELTNTC